MKEVYYSENFDLEYEKYATYVRKYDFLEHMPFCINSKHISESLLAVYLHCDKGFGESSFVKKMNKYVIKSIKSSIISGYDYDLKYSFLKRLVGKWRINKIILNISIQERSFLCNLNGKKWSGELINTAPESDRFIKCDIFNYGGYDINSFFDENLNLIIDFDEYSYIQNNDQDYRNVRIILASGGLGDLNIECIDDSYFFDDYCFVQDTIKLEKIVSY